MVKSETFVYFANTEIPWNISQLAMDVATVRLEDQFVDSEIQHIIPILHNEALSRFSDVESWKSVLDLGCIRQSIISASYYSNGQLQKTFKIFYLQNQ